ncbi:hypothetical protein CP061683_1310B, partial [Chlamydia psittaci 06-1683]
SNTVHGSFGASTNDHIRASSNKVLIGGIYTIV